MVKATLRSLAKVVGLTVPQARVLLALCKHPKGLTYREIEKRTGDYSILTAVLRVEKPNSLGDKGLIKEEMYDIDNRDVLVFVPTAKGKFLARKLKK